MATVLEKLRVQYTPRLPNILESLQRLVPEKGDHLRELGGAKGELTERFSHLLGQPTISFRESDQPVQHRPLKVGVVLSGGQAAGGHNVIIALHDSLKKLNPKSQLIGFLDGPSGIINNKKRFLEATEIDKYRNTGGFDLLGSGRTKIETDQQFTDSLKTVRELDLDGLVVIGGDDSNTNAALLAEYFRTNGCKTTVVGVPKTIDGDLKNEHIEISFGFDTACKTYSEILSNVMRDTLSAKKYWYFVKLMGRSASHIALEVALQTQPNLTWLGEEVEASNRTLNDLVTELTDLVCERSQKGKDYGIVLIPEGIIEFIPEVKKLIQELNSLLASGSDAGNKLGAIADPQQRCETIAPLLSEESKRCFNTIPLHVRSQLLLDRDPHGNVQVSKIETERLFIEMVEEELAKRGKSGSYKGKFSAQPMFLGYEGRSAFPSNFDCQYCTALGYVATLLIEAEATGYMSTVQNLTTPPEDWGIGGVPLIAMIHEEERDGKHKPVIKKALVNLNGPVFTAFNKKRDAWKVEDAYHFQGPIQFYGPTEVADTVTLTLDYEKNAAELWAY